VGPTIPNVATCRSHTSPAAWIGTYASFCSLHILRYLPYQRISYGAATEARERWGRVIPSRQKALWTRSSVSWCWKSKTARERSCSLHSAHLVRSETSELSNRQPSSPFSLLSDRTCLSPPHLLSNQDILPTFFCHITSETTEQGASSPQIAYHGSN
jgi:hypothetical protein